MDAALNMATELQQLHKPQALVRHSRPRLRRFAHFVGVSHRRENTFFSNRLVGCMAGLSTVFPKWRHGFNI